MNQSTSSDIKYEIYAHRGNGEHDPHNSLQCFTNAVKNDHLDGVEFDVIYLNLLYLCNISPLNFEIQINWIDIFIQN